MQEQPVMAALSLVMAELSGQALQPSSPTPSPQVVAVHVQLRAFRAVQNHPTLTNRPAVWF
jgi:hypothetical protein